MSKSLFKAVLIVGAGGLFEAGDWLKQQLADQEANQSRSTKVVIIPQEADEKQLPRAATGLVLGAARSAGHGLHAARRVAGAAGSVAAVPLAGLVNSRPLAPLRRELTRLEQRASAQVEDWGRIGQIEIDRSRGLAREVLARGVDAAAGLLSQNPGVHDLIHDQLERVHDDPAFQSQLDGLVRSLVGNYLDYLVEHPDEIDALIQTRANTYIEHLAANPRQVEALVRAQANTYVEHLSDNPGQIEPLVRAQANAYVRHLSDNSQQVKTLVRAQADAYIAHLIENPEQVEALIRAQAGNYIEHLSDNSQQVETLVRAQADAYIAHLIENPEQVEALVRAQADVYIDHLSENPEQVQTLVRGQSAGLANEVTNEVRGRLSTADSALETVLRRALRRPGRADLPEPPPEVQALAGPRLAYAHQDKPRLDGADQAYE